MAKQEERKKEEEEPTDITSMRPFVIRTNGKGAWIDYANSDVTDLEINMILLLLGRVRGLI